MSRGLSQQQVEILRLIDARARENWWDYEQSRRYFNPKRGLWRSGASGPGPTFDPWESPKRIALEPVAEASGEIRLRPAGPSRLRSVERAMVSLAKRGLLVRAERGATCVGGYPACHLMRRHSLTGWYTTPKAAAKWRRQQARRR